MVRRREVHAVAKLEAEQTEIMVRNNWPASLMAFVDVPPEDIDRLREIQRLLRLDRMTRCEGQPGGGTAESEIVVDRIDEAAPASSFKIGEAVCLAGGGHEMTVIYAGPDCDDGDTVVTVAWSTFPGPDIKTRNFPPGALKAASYPVD